MTDDGRTRPRFRWFAVPGYGQRMPREASMRGRWGWDVVCTADGWDSRTGGATRRAVLAEIDEHLLHAHGLIAVDGKVYAALDEEATE